MDRIGFYKTAQGLTIDKDYKAELTYSLDWVEWLDIGDELATVVFESSPRANDPAPIIIAGSGIRGTETYVSLKDGKVNTSYPITATITTVNGLTDARRFVVRVLKRSA